MWLRALKTSIRELKSKLSEHIRTAASGEDVIVSAHGRPVAKITAVGKSRDLKQLRDEPGISWSGGKPLGLSRAAGLRGERQISDLVAEDRR